MRPSSSSSALDLSANQIPDEKTCSERENTRRPEGEKEEDDFSQFTRCYCIYKPGFLINSSPNSEYPTSVGP